MQQGGVHVNSCTVSMLHATVKNQTTLISLDTRLTTKWLEVFFDLLMLYFWEVCKCIYVETILVINYLKDFFDSIFDLDFPQTWRIYSWL